MSLVELLSWIVVALAGAISHEIAHYLVWVVTGRKPQFDLIGLQVTPTAGPATGTLGDRVAAAAPYVSGLAALLVAFVMSSALWAIFGVAMIQLPSAADRAAMHGDVTWASLVE